MKHFRTFAVALVIICIPLSGSAQTSAEHKQKLVDEVTETLALSHKVTQPPADFANQFKRNPFRLQKKTNQQWLNAFKKAYSDKRLMQDYRTILADKLNQLSAKKLHTWLNQPSTQKLAEARQEHYSLQGKRKRIVAWYELEQDPPPKERQNLIAAYADAITPKDAIIESSIPVFQSIIKTIDQVSTRLSFTDTQISTIVNNFRKRGPKRIKRLREKKLPVKFYGISSNTIEESLDFWQSETGQSLAKAIYASLKRTYEKAGQRLSKAVNTNN